MARRKMTDVEDMPLVGGRLCLDFVNTTGAREREESRERLHSYRDLLVWARRVELVAGDEARRLEEERARDPAAARAALDRALRIREVLYAVFRPLAEGEDVDGSAATDLNGLLSAAAVRRKLVFGPEGASWTWPHDERDLTWFLGPILQSAEELLTAGDLDRLARCGAGRCDWLFLDETRNRSRRWCKKRCGDRMRARRRYRRQRDG